MPTTFVVSDGSWHAFVTELSHRSTLERWLSASSCAK
jgi:hypothetical protein